MSERTVAPVEPRGLPPPGERPGGLHLPARWQDGVRLLRPHQWVKNIFVLAPLLFSEHALTAPNAVRTGLAWCVFSLVASAVYVFNDLIDLKADRLHPRKCRRPLAAGRISPAVAVGVGLALVLAAAILSTAALPLGVLVLAGAYLANSILYCVWLKRRVIVDVLLIAGGFVLRMLAGCAAIEVEASSWLVVCSFSLALVLGFGKRRTEVEQLAGRDDIRGVLRVYNSAKLDSLLSITTAVCLVAYMLYTVAPETVAQHHTRNLIYTVPFVTYGLFRYLFKVQEGKGDGPTEILISDHIFPITGLLWGASVVVVLYLWRGVP
jgi:4-hydroxybenzoate polyprenyltransferase